MVAADALTNALIFALACGLVWWSANRLAARADLLAERAEIGRVFAGALLLGVATSLPEIATTVSAAASGAGELAGHNLLGGVAMQMAVLALVDTVALRGRPITLFSPYASMMLHGVFLSLLLAVAAMATVAPDVAILGRLSPWSLALAALYLVTLFYLHRYEGQPRWEPRGEIEQPPQSAVDMKDAVAAEHADTSRARILLGFIAYAFLVLVGGYQVARSGEALAVQTGLGEGFVGAIFVAIATSLPEVSTTYGAVRMGAYSMAVGNILGTNALELALFLPADLAYSDGSIFALLGEGAVLLAALGIVLTLIYVWGMLERADRTIFGLCGVDSALVTLCYVGGMLLFSRLV